MIQIDIDNEQEMLLPRKREPMINLTRQAVILKAIETALKVIIKGNKELIKYHLELDEERKSSSSDEDFLLFLKKIVLRKDPINESPTEVNTFVDNFAAICFKLSRLYLDTRDNDTGEIFRNLSKVFYDCSINDENDQKQPDTISNSCYFTFKFCMEFITSHFFAKLSNQVVTQITNKLRELLENPTFRKHITQAVSQNASREQFVKSWIGYLYPTPQKGYFIVETALFFWRNCTQASPPPRTLEEVPSQSNEINFQEAMLTAIAGPLELINNFLCEKLKMFRFFCVLNYSFTQASESFNDSDAEQYYTALIGTEIEEHTENIRAIIKNIYWFQAIIDEFNFFLEYESLLHPGIIRQKQSLLTAMQMLKEHCQKLSASKAEILKVLFHDNAYRLKVAGLSEVHIPDEMQCCLTFQIMTTPVYDPNFPERIYEKKSLERSLERDGRDPYTRQPIDIEAYVENKNLKEKIRLFVEAKLHGNAYRLEMAGLTEVHIPDEMQCCLTFQIMTTPVYDPNFPERIYEKKSLEQSLGRDGRDPYTRRLIDIEAYVENKNLKEKIRLFVEATIENNVESNDDTFSISIRP